MSQDVAIYTFPFFTRQRIDWHPNRIEKTLGNWNGKEIVVMARIMQTLVVLCLLACLAQGVRAEAFGSSPAAKKPLDYQVTKLRVAANRTTEYRLFFQGKHFLTVLLDAKKAVAIRPHPGDDPNGFGSTWYPDAFLPGAVLRKGDVSLKATAIGIRLKASGIVSRGEKSSLGNWNMTLFFTFDPAAKQVSGLGTYAIKLTGFLGDATGDLNICKIATNYLTRVPLLGGTTGNTGDMKQADVSGDFPPFAWIPPDQPAFFPNDQTTTLTINVEGQFNNVDTAAQGLPAIAAAFKPSLQVSYDSLTPEARMTFGAAYDLAASQLFSADNVGITPLILKSTALKKFQFEVAFQSVALPGDH